MSSQICYFPETMKQDKAIANVLPLTLPLPLKPQPLEGKVIHYFPELNNAQPEDLNTLTDHEQALTKLTNQIKEKLSFEESYMDVVMQLDGAIANDTKAEDLLQKLIATTVQTTVTEVQTTPQNFQLEHPKSPWLPGYLKQWVTPEATQTAKDNAFKQEQQLQLSKVGQLLKRTRIKRGFSHTHLNNMTHIIKGHILAIETGELDKLPEPLYVKGFIRRLGDALELNGEAIAATFPVKQDLPYGKINTDKTPESWQVEACRYVGYTALMMGAVGSLSWSLSNAQRTVTPVQPVTPPTANQTADEVTPQIVQTEAKITPPEMMPTP